MEPSPGLRPLTVQERVRTWGMGAVPSSFIYIGLKAVTYLLEDSDRPLWAYLMSGNPTVNLPLPIGDGGGIDLQLIFYLSRSFYVVAYFTWGRAFGHLLAGAYVVDRNTMQPMGLGRKLLRGLFTVATAPIFPFMDLLSLLMIYIDREQRRSVYDWVAGTLVVMGDLPPAPERAARRSWLGEWSRALRRRPAAESRG